MGVIPENDKGLSLKVKEWMLEKQDSGRETDFNKDQIEHHSCVTQCVSICVSFSCRSFRSGKKESS